MTTIYIEEELNLEKTHFKTMEEFQLYLEMTDTRRSDNFTLSEAHIKILVERIKEADEANEPGLTWEEIKAELGKGDD